MNAGNLSISEQTSLVSNWTSDLPEIEPQKYPEFVRYVALIVGIPFAVFGITGNLLTIIAVLKTKSLRKGTNFFIISLSTFDLIFSCFVIPTAISVNWNNAWIFSSAYCCIYPMIQWLAAGEVLLSLSGVAVGRCLKIVYPPKFTFIFGNKLYTAIFLCSFWIVPVLLLLPAVTGVWGHIGYEPKTLICTILRDDTNYMTFLLISAYAIPITFISFCYLRILCKVCSNHKKVQAARQQIAARASDVNAKHGHKEQREDLRYTKMMVAIFIVFLMAYAPYMINSLIDPHHENMARGFFMSSCVWFSSCLNPVIYVLLNRQFRRAVLTVLPCNCGWCNPDRMELSELQLQSSINTNATG